MKSGILALMALTTLPVALVSEAAHVARNVPPIEYAGVRYVVPNDDGWRGHVQAWDVKTNKLLWDATIYRVVVTDTNVEPDCTWVLIKEMKLQDANLILLDERDWAYQLNPKSGRSTRITREEQKYTVQTGDTLSSIVKRTKGNDTVQDMVLRNRIETPDQIRPGQVLILRMK